MSLPVNTRAIDPVEQVFAACMIKQTACANAYSNGTAAHVEWSEGWETSERGLLELCSRDVAAGYPHPDDER